MIVSPRQLFWLPLTNQTKQNQAANPSERSFHSLEVAFQSISLSPPMYHFRLVFILSARFSGLNNSIYIYMHSKNRQIWWIKTIYINYNNYTCPSKQNKVPFIDTQKTERVSVKFSFFKVKRANGGNWILRMLRRCTLPRSRFDFKKKTLFCCVSSTIKCKSVAFVASRVCSFWSVFRHVNCELQVKDDDFGKICWADPALFPEEPYSSLEKCDRKHMFGCSKERADALVERKDQPRIKQFKADCIHLAGNWIEKFIHVKYI